MDTLISIVAYFVIAAIAGTLIGVIVDIVQQNIADARRYRRLTKFYESKFRNEE